MSVALVLGAGGSAALGWETGVLAGLADEGVLLPDGLRVVGTSAGSLLAGRRSRPADGDLESGLADVAALRPPSIDFAEVAAGWARSAAGASSAQDARRRIGDAAKAATTMDPAERREEIAVLAGRQDWPPGEVLVTAVSADTGRFVTFDRDCGVEWLDAVGASCAVPSVWPTVVIDGEHFMDGSVLSPTNLPAAAPCTRAVVLAPLLPELGGGIAREIERLGEGSAVEVVAADAGSQAAFGPNPLDPRVTLAAAQQGRRQGRGAAARVRALLA